MGELRVHVALLKHLNTSRSRHDSFSLEDSQHSMVHTARCSNTFASLSRLPEPAPRPVKTGNSYILDVAEYLSTDLQVDVI